MNKFPKNIGAKDLHFNLFYSYSGGSSKLLNKNDEIEDLTIGKDKRKRMELLEDNLTRAFLITIGSLSPEDIKKYFNLLFAEKKVKIRSANRIDLDLQNYDEENEVLYEKIHNTNVTKIILTISDVMPNFTEESLFSLVNKTRKTQVGGSRPDGWIFFDDAVILIESKVGDNKVYEDQLARHIIQQFEVKNISVSQFHYIKKSWKEIADAFDLLKISKNMVNDIFITDFREVLMKTGQILDLSFITKDNGYNRLTARSQFKPFLIKLDEEIKNYFPDLKRANRPLADYIWDYYGRVEKGKVMQDPHYSIYFDKDYAGIYLTTKNINQLVKFLDESNNTTENQSFHSFLQRKCFGIKRQTNLELSRYYLELINYRLIDRLLNPQKKSRRGPSIETFKFELSFAELRKDDDLKLIKKRLKSLKDLSKQFQLGIKILYPFGNVKNINEDSIRKDNRKFFDDFNLLLKLYLDFIKETSIIYNDLKK